jgi:tetratricopeptide (TPR) repeat protein
MGFKISWCILVITIVFTSNNLFAQSGVESAKVKGLGYLHSGQSDSALLFLHQSMLEGVKDGEVLGGIALAYFLEGNEEKALEMAREARKRRYTTTSDAYLAGALAHELLGDARKRNRWLSAGLKSFPNDYLLLYHAGRVTILDSPNKAEAFLLKAVHNEPGFGPAHLLLGESMFRKGEHLKAILPLFYYLLLHHDVDESPSLVAGLEHLFTNWAVSSEGILRPRNVSRGLTSGFVPQPWKGEKTDRDGKREWFVLQAVLLLESLNNVELTSDEALWSYYTDFFLQSRTFEFCRTYGNAYDLQSAQSRNPGMDFCKYRSISNDG